MKLAFIHPFFLRYARGIERYTANLASALAKTGVQVDVLSWRWPNPLSWKELYPTVRVLTGLTPKYFAAKLIWPFYLKRLFQERYDHIFINFADYGEAQAIKLISLIRSQPFSVVLHFPYSQVPHRYHSLTSSHLFERACHVVAVSSYVREQMQAYSGKICELIPHGVDASLFRNNPTAKHQLCRELGLDPRANLILSVCALEMRKGVQHVMRSLPLLKRAIPGVEYLVVGDGPDSEKLRRISKELNVADYTHFLPATPNVQPFYQAADLFVILANGEASSMVSLEALSSELPVVASKHPPFNELINPAWGYQVNEENPDQVASVIERLLTERETREQMGKAGRQYILKHHNWDVIAEQYLGLLR